MTRERSVGHQDLTRLGGFADASGDVDVDPEVVTAEPPRPAPVDACAHSGPVPIELDVLQSFLGFERAIDRTLRSGERRHQAVSEPLNDPAVVGDDRGFDDGVGLAQKLERGGVPNLQLPRGELDEIGEHDRELGMAAPTADGFRKRLPHLQHGEADVMHDALALRPQSGDAASEDLHRGHARGRERIAEVLVSGETSPDSTGGREQRRVGVEADGGAP